MALWGAMWLVGGRAQGPGDHTTGENRRIGEASNPGPPKREMEARTATIASANITSLHAGWDSLMQVEADLYLVQEARIVNLEMERASARRHRAQLVPGPVSEDGVTYLAVIVKKGSYTPLQVKGGDGRLQAGICHIGGATPYLVYHIYGAQGTAEGLRQTSRLVTAALEDSTERAACPH